MVKNLLIFIFGLTLSSCFDDQIRATERISAVLIEPGYYISENDSTFEFSNQRYLIKTIEFFDDEGIISKVAIRKSEGYLEFSKAEFSKLKNFLRQHGFSEALKVFFSDDKHITVNKRSFIVRGIDRKRKMIFYTSNASNDILYCLIFR